MLITATFTSRLRSEHTNPALEAAANPLDYARPPNKCLFAVQVAVRYSPISSAPDMVSPDSFPENRYDSASPCDSVTELDRRTSSPEIVPDKSRAWKSP